MPKLIIIPDDLVDANWKAKEKEIKLRATGIGKTLREIDEEAKNVNKKMSGQKNRDELASAFNELKAAFATAKTQIDKNAKKLKPGDAKNHLESMSERLRLLPGEFDSRMPEIMHGDNQDMNRSSDRLVERINMRLEG